LGLEKDIKENLKEIKEESKEPTLKGQNAPVEGTLRNLKLAKLAKDKNRVKKSIAESNDPRLKIINEMKMDNPIIKPRSTYSVKQGIKDKEYGSNKSKGKSILTTNILSTNHSDGHKGDYFTRVRTTTEDDDEGNEIIGSINTMSKMLQKPKLSDTSNKKQLDKILNNDDSKLLMDNNVIKRDTFIDNNFNKKLRSNEVPQANLIDEVYTNSDMRIKKYGILFNFINSNLKEITELVNNQNNKIIEETIEGYSFENISSFLATSFKEDFYKNLDNTINLTIVNVSNDASTLRTKIGISMFDKTEKTECQFSLLDNDSEIDITTKRDAK
jgi:hypothetical protein